LPTLSLAFASFALTRECPLLRLACSPKLTTRPTEEVEGPCDLARNKPEEQGDDARRRDEKAVRGQGAGDEGGHESGEDEQDERPTQPGQEGQGNQGEPKGDQHNHRGTASVR
jgi:hypothetical protein